jgi:hypothetical protein
VAPDTDVRAAESHDMPPRPSSDPVMF